MKKLNHILEYAKYVDNFDGLIKKFQKSRYISRSEMDKLNKSNLKFTDFEELVNSCMVCYDFFKLQDLDLLDTFISDLADENPCIDTETLTYNKIKMGVDYHSNGREYHYNYNRPATQKISPLSGGTHYEIEIDDSFLKEPYDMAVKVVDYLTKVRSSNIASKKTEYSAVVNKDYPYNNKDAREYQRSLNYYKTSVKDEESKKYFGKTRLLPYFKLAIYLRLRTNEFDVATYYGEEELRLNMEGRKLLDAEKAKLTLQVNDLMSRYLTSVGTVCTYDVNLEQNYDIEKKGHGFIKYTILLDPRRTLGKYSDKM